MEIGLDIIAFQKLFLFFLFFFGEAYKIGEWWWRRSRVLFSMFPDILFFFLVSNLCQMRALIDDHFWSWKWTGRGVEGAYLGSDRSYTYL